jgi:hypothetical protein
MARLKLFEEKNGKVSRRRETIFFEEKNGKVSRRRETMHAMRAIFRYFVLSVRFGIAAAVVDCKKAAGTKIDAVA